MAITIHPVCRHCHTALVPDHERWEWSHAEPADSSAPRLCHPGDSWASADPIVTARGRDTDGRAA